MGLHINTPIPAGRTGYKKGIQEEVGQAYLFSQYEILLATPMAVFFTRPHMWMYTSHCKAAWRLETSHSHIKSIKNKIPLSPLQITSTIQALNNLKGNP